MINFSELLWNPEKTSRRIARDPEGEEQPQIERSGNLQDVPVEEVHVEPSYRIVLLTDPSGPGADRFRLLRMRLRELQKLAKLQSLVITSPLPEDGKSTIALNLATALAEGGKNSVLLVEADLYHPTLAERLGVPVLPGLAECLEDNIDPLSVLRRIEPAKWYLLQAGKTRGNPSELLQSDVCSRVLRTISHQFDWIILDTPPVAPLTDALSLTRHVDGTLLVVRADQTPKETIEESLLRIGRERVVGIVVNGAEALNKSYSKYYGYYARK
jgi:capsular exopolysaccharide synthesis family protein